MSEPHDETAGVVVYTQKPEGWDGVWSHDGIGGRLARELVPGANLDALPGRWSVETRAPDGTVMYAGSLAAATLGQCVKLVWTGSLANGEPAKYEGIGYRMNAATLVATFQRVD